MIVTMLGFAMVVLLISNSASAQKKKINARLDIAFVLPTGQAIGDFDSGTIPKTEVQFYKGLHAIPDEHVEMNENRARIALVGSHDASGFWINYPSVVLNTTGDRSAFDKAIAPFYQSLGYTFSGDRVGLNNIAFKNIREQLFNTPKEPRRARIIIILVNDVPSPEKAEEARREAAEEAKKLRDGGVLIYAVYNKENANLLDEVLGYTGGKRSRVFECPAPNFFEDSVAKLREVKMSLFRDICGWHAICRYPDATRKACMFDVWQDPKPSPYFDDNNEQCDTVKPSADKTCGIKDCEEECDREWPWKGSELNCPNDCGKTRERTSSTPPTRLENCEHSRICEECTTTSTSTTSTTTTSTTTTTTTTPTTTSTTSTTTSTTTTTEPTTTTSTTTTTEPETTTTSQSTTSTTVQTTTASTTEGTTAASTTQRSGHTISQKAIDHSETGTGSATIAHWLIALIVTLIALLLLLIIIVAIMVSRRRRKAAAEAAAQASRKKKEDELKKKQAAEKQKQVPKKEKSSEPGSSFMGFVGSDRKRANASVLADIGTDAPKGGKSKAAVSIKNKPEEPKVGKSSKLAEPKAGKLSVPKSEKSLSTKK